MADHEATDERDRTPRQERRVATVETGSGSVPASDRVLDVLADERRRVVLSYLHGKPDDVASFVELIDHVAGHETAEGDGMDVIAVSLYYVHLPKLADAGLVEYDRRSRTIRYRGDGTVATRAERVEREEVI